MCKFSNKHSVLACAPPIMAFLSQLSARHSVRFCCAHIFLCGCIPLCSHNACQSKAQAHGHRAPCYWPCTKDFSQACRPSHLSRGTHLTKPETFRPRCINYTPLHELGLSTSQEPACTGSAFLNCIMKFGETCFNRFRIPEIHH